MKLFVFTEFGGVMGTKTRLFHENGTEIEGLTGVVFSRGGLPGVEVEIDLIGAEVRHVDHPPENAAQNSINALRELVAVKQMREEVLRRKQRRLCSIERDPKEMRAVDKLHEKCKVREARAWNVARTLVAQETTK